MRQRRAIRDMPYRRRHEGLNPGELEVEIKLWQSIVVLLTMLFYIPVYARPLVVNFITTLLAAVAHIRFKVYNALDPINPENKNKLIGDWSDEECYALLNFRREQLYEVMHYLQIPAFLTCGNGMTCRGEYAFCLVRSEL